VLLECVVNVSEGRNEAVLGELAAAAGTALLDRHRDPDHNRTVFTLAGPARLVAESSRALARATLSLLDLRSHQGAHPRLGVLDVVPFVPYEPGRAGPEDLTAAVAARDAFASWLGTQMGVPSFLYGPLPGGRARTLPDIRRLAFGPAPDGVHPDAGPAQADARHGATAVGARRVLVAYNVWVSSVGVARQVAPLVRGPFVRALGLAVGSRAQVSCNLIDPGAYGPARLYDAVAALAGERGGGVEGGELVGLVPEVVLAAVPSDRRAELGVSEEATVESRLPANW
jgi:glutamate formiminotransferase / 5-formyltetrahydrofolate cyclo-ligase